MYISTTRNMELEYKEKMQYIEWLLFVLNFWLMYLLNASCVQMKPQEFFNFWYQMLSY